MTNYERDPENELVLRWGGDDGDGIGKLHVVAATNGFRGTSAAWFDRLAILDFADRLGRFPLPSDDSPSISGGFGGDDPQEHVGIVAAPVGPRGQVGLRVHLSTEVWRDTRPESVHEVHLELLTTYQRLASCSRDIRAVVSGDAPEAVLGGEVLA